MSEWQPITTAPVGPLVIASNDKTGDVFPAYGYWTDGIPMPRWFSIDPEGTGRCKPTHWREMPSPPEPEAVA